MPDLAKIVRLVGPLLSNSSLATAMVKRCNGTTSGLGLLEVT